MEQFQLKAILAKKAMQLVIIQSDFDMLEFDIRYLQAYTRFYFK